MTINSSLMTNHFKKADKIMQYFVVGLFFYSLLLASWYNTWLEAFLIGGGTLAAVVAIVQLSGGSVLSRIVIGAALMVMTALHIHQAHGMIEMHFGVFALLAILLFYRDAVAVVSGAATIAVHHIVFYYFQTQGAGVWVLESGQQDWWVIFLHAAYVVVETAVILYMSSLLKKEAIQSVELSESTRRIVQKDSIDLTHRSSGKTPLLQQFDQYTARIEALVQQVQKLGGGLSTASCQVNNVTTALEQYSATQNSETDMIATAVEEMSTAISDVSSNASKAAEAAADVENNARNCGNANTKTGESIDQLARQIEEAVTTIESLNEKTGSIGNVVNVIRSVADQTNLLALNAAIEAARAGEQGRGFAVVADEVRSLAQRSQESTEEIDKMIESLQAQSSSAVSVIKSSSNLVDACVENTQESLRLMEQVSQAINEINNLNALIATATHEQTLATQEINKNINNIVQASQDSMSQVHIASSSSHELEEYSNQLGELTRKFVVSSN